MRETDYKLGAHFKIFKLFWEILENNSYMLEKADNKTIIRPIKLFAHLNKVKFLKDRLMFMIKRAD